MKKITSLIIMISLSFMVFSQDIEADSEYKPAPSQEKRQALVFYGGR